VAPNGYVNSIALQSDGKIVLGGYFTTLSGQPYSRIGRFHADGTLDSDFSPVASDSVLSLAIQEDGKVFTDAATTWTIPPKSLMIGTNGQQVSFAHPVAQVDTIEELGQGTERRLESEQEFDNYGNQILHTDYGIVEKGDRNAFDDERIIATEYALNLDAWIIRHTKRQETRKLDGTVISRTES